MDGRGRAVPKWTLRIVLIGCFLAGFWTGFDRQAPGFAVAQEPIHAPDFTLKSNGGKNIKLSELRGQVVMVNFWATWCAPCEEELPVFNRLYEKYRLMGLEILGVSIDKSPSAAAEFGRRLGLNFPILFDPSGSLSEKYRITSMPSTAVVAKDGTIRYVHRGFLPSDPSNYDKEIRSLLKEGVQ